MKLVQFENGKYGIKVGRFFGYKFLDLDGDCIWHEPRCVLKYCQGTKEEALKAKELKLKQDLKEKPMKYTYIKGETQ